MSNKRLIARLYGGLGNQLFIYAAARALASRNEVPLYLDTISGFENDTLYRRNYLLNHFPIKAHILPRAETLTGPFGKLRFRWLRWAEGKKEFRRRTFINESPLVFDQRLLDFRIINQLQIEGYWQSYRYFQKESDLIARDLSSPRLPSAEKLHENAICSGSSVSIHIRRSQLSHPLGVDYYEKAIHWMSQNISNPVWIVFSDSSSDAYAILPKTINAHYVIRNTSDDKTIEDFTLMRMCKHHIIANSTFSWWAAWLSTGEDKRVVAPKPGPNWGHDGLLPPDWTTF
jgi:hypothetical protein